MVISHSTEPKTYEMNPTYAKEIDLLYMA